MNDQAVLSVKPLGFPWETPDPFLFCVYHEDAYPKGNEILGPGLTPSGDDFVGGMLIALRMLGENGAADAVARWALPLAKQRTNRISVAHLEAAVEGQGAAALHQVLEWLGSSGSKNRLPKPHILGKVGHCSGWDMLSGVVMACRGHARGTARLPLPCNG